MNRVKLILPRKEFESNFEEQIRQGASLNNKYTVVAKNSRLQLLNQFQQEYEEWDDYNSELLKQSFTTPNNDYFKDYNYVEPTITVSSFDYDVNDDYNILFEEISEKIKRLKKIKNKINLIPIVFAENNEEVLARSNNKVLIMINYHFPIQNLLNMLPKISSVDI